MNKISTSLFHAAAFGAFFLVGGRAAEASIEMVVRADQARLKAMESGDGAALVRVFSDEIVFVHSDGRAEGKMDYTET